MKLPKRSALTEPVKSPYGLIALYQFSDEVVALTLDDTVMSLVNTSDPRQIPSPYIAEIAARVRENDTVVHLGVAGGTLAGYIAAQFASVKQVGVEINQQIVNVAREHLGLPRAPKLKVRIADAFTEVKLLPASRADLIVVDIFNADASLSSEIFEPDFIRSCVNALAPNGQVCINVMDIFSRAPIVSKLKMAIKQSLLDRSITIGVDVPGKKHKPNALTNHLVWFSVRTDL